jgi:hypothetical protein
MKVTHDKEMMENTKLKRASGEDAHIDRTELMMKAVGMFTALNDFNKAIMELFAKHKLTINDRNLEGKTKVAHHKMMTAQIEHVVDFLKTMHEQLENIMTAAQNMQKDKHQQHDEIERFMEALVEYAVLAIRNVDAIVLYLDKYSDLAVYQVPADQAIKQLSEAIFFSDVMKRLYLKDGNIPYIEQLFDAKRNHLVELQNLIVHAKCKINGKYIATISDLTDEAFEACANKFIDKINKVPGISNYDHCNDLKGAEITHEHVQKCLNQVSHHEGEHHEAIEKTKEVLNAVQKHMAKVPGDDDEDGDMMSDEEQIDNDEDEAMDDEVTDEAAADSEANTEDDDTIEMIDNTESADASDSMEPRDESSDESEVGDE